MTWILALLFGIAAGGLNRLRGSAKIGSGEHGAIDPTPAWVGSQIKRLALSAALVGGMVAAHPAALTAQWWIIPALLALQFVGWLREWGPFMDLGRMSYDGVHWADSAIDWLRDGRPRAYWREFLGLTLMGILITLPAGALLLVATWPDPSFYGLAGLLMAPLYELAWRSPLKSPNGGGPPLGELLFGFALGAAAVLA